MFYGFGSLFWQGICHDYRVKHGLNIVGWNVQESLGYYRAFRKVGGKMKAVYLGKNLDGAEQKIMAKQEQLAGGDPK